MTCSKLPDDMRVFYGTTNVGGGTGVLHLRYRQLSAASGTFVLPFGPTGGLTANLITIVMNQGGGINWHRLVLYRLRSPPPDFTGGNNGRGRTSP
jgi:hypothetical protein